MKNAITFFNHEMQPREMSKEELQNEFIDALWDNVNYWTYENKETNVREKIAGAIFSTLTLIDGARISNNGYEITAIGNKDDMDAMTYSVLDGENYRPVDNVCINDNIDLHELFYLRDTERRN